MASTVTRRFVRTLYDSLSVVDRCALTSYAHSRPLKYGNYKQIRFASKFRAAVMKEVGKPLVIEQVSAPKKIAKDQVSLIRLEI